MVRVLRGNIPEVKLCVIDWSRAICRIFFRWGVLVLWYNSYLLWYVSRCCFFDSGHPCNSAKYVVYFSVASVL